MVEESDVRSQVSDGLRLKDVSSKARRYTVASYCYVLPLLHSNCFCFTPLSVQPDIQIATIAKQIPVDTDRQQCPSMLRSLTFTVVICDDDLPSSDERDLIVLYNEI